MKLKGTMVLELTDGATGEVETVTEENMVTEAVNDILGMNPMGCFIRRNGWRMCCRGMMFCCRSARIW